MLIVSLLFILTLIVIMYFTNKKTYKEIEKLKSDLKIAKSEKMSEAVKRGLVVEKLLPFSNLFKYDPLKFVPLYKPIDGIIFNKDEIIFIEIKSGNAKLSKKQSHIKKLIKDKRVRFEELRY